jgi:hypothetical protein
LPAAITSAGIDADTTLPAPITELRPIETPLRMMLPSPTKTFSSSSTAAVFGRPPRR